MSIRPQDIVVSVKLALVSRPTYPELAKALDMSLSEVHGAVKRATAAGLVGPDRKANRVALLDFLLQGVKHAFVPKRGQLTRGMPTAHGAPPLDQLVGAGAEPPPVWPDPEGTVRGESFAPLYRSVPKAAKKDPKLYEVLCLIDAIRGGRPRDHALAEQHLRRLLLPATVSETAARLTSRTAPTSEPRRQRILRGLAKVGTGPESYYRGALDILDREPPLAAGSLLVAHLAREIESSLRQVLNAMRAIDEGSGDENDSSADEKHQESIRSALAVLGISADSPLAQTWFGFSGRWNESGLHKRAHRKQLGPSRPIDSDFLSFWDTFEGVLDQVLESLDKRYLIVFDRVDKLLAIPRPGKKAVGTLRGNIPQSQVILDYFFTKLENPVWIQPLEKAGFFARPPAPSVESGGTLYPSWPALKYLTRMAPLAPRDVTRIALAVPTTDNFRVYEGLAEIALSLPASFAAELVNRVEAWLEVDSGDLLSHGLTKNIVGLVEKLATDGNADAAVHVLHSLLRPIPAAKGKRRGGFRDDPRSRLADWDLRLAVNKLSPTISSLKQPALEMLSGLLEAIASHDHESANTEAWDDHSWIWRPAIEDHTANHDDGLRAVLVSATRDVAVHLVEADGTRLSNTVAFLEARQWIVFRRLALHLLERFLLNSTELAIRRLLDRSSFESHRLEHEYCRLLRACFGKLSPQQRDEILSWIDAGPGDSSAASVRTKYADQWRLQYLTLIEDALPDKWRTRFEVLKSTVGPQTPPDQLPSVEDLVLPPSALSRDELATLTPEQLVTTLGAWKPSGQFDRFERTELWRSVSSIVEASPETYSANAKTLELLDPHCLYGALSGFRAAIRENRSFEWSGPLDLCAFATSQRRNTRVRKVEHADEEGAWGETCKAVLWLLTEGMTTSNNPIPIEYKARVWSAIEATLDDPDGRGGPPLNDPMGASLNRVRGAALQTAIDYALWIARRTSTKRLPAEVRKALEAKLRERSDAIRAVFGNRIDMLAYLDGAWCKKHVHSMFRREDGRDPAWATYLSYGRLNLEVFRLLRWRYKDAIRTMHGTTPDPRDRSGNVIGGHLGQLYWHGKLSFGERDALLETFFAEAPPSVAGHLIEVLGLWLHEDTPPSPDVLRRLRGLWEKRVALGRKEELAAFGRWFSSARFEDEWSLDQLQKVLSRAVYPRADQEVAARLTEMLPQYLSQVLACVELLILADETGWGVFSWKVPASTILAAAMASDDAGTKRSAEALINRLCSKGHLEFRELLRKGKAA
jgi:hypothetical protein